MKDKIPVCPHVSREGICKFLVSALEQLVRVSKFELKFSSGYRCEACNAAAGGAKNSAHLRGRAVDIFIGDSQMRFQVLSSVSKLGFRRIGIGRTFIHLDVDVTLPQDVMWLY